MGEVVRVENPAGGLADAAGVLSHQFRRQLRRFGLLLSPHAASLERRFITRLRQLGYGPRQRRALAALTAAAAARIFGRGRPPAEFIEQVEYHGRRLAKLNLPPRAVDEALSEFERLLPAAIGRLGRRESANLEWVRGHLRFCVLLALNKAYYQVREAEAQAFYGLTRAEMGARSLQELLEASLEVLVAYCGAQEAQLYWADEAGSAWVLRAGAKPGGRGGSVQAANPWAVRRTPAQKRLLGRPRLARTEGRSAGVVLDESWRRRYVSVWSVPLVAGGRVAGVMQFGFARHYEWLPRELELLEGAAERCLAAAERARLIEDLWEREKRIRRLAEHMLHIEEQERRRISRELHDEAGQSLLYLRLQLELMQKEAAERRPEWQSRLEELRRVTEHTIVEARRLISALSPAVLEQLGLAAAVRQLVKRFRQAHPCRVRLRLGELGGLPSRVQTVAYRLLQECCNNIAKHSQASTVNISLGCTDGRLRLCVADDGVGFCPDEALAAKNSFGLAGMRERVQLLGGTFEVASGVRRCRTLAGGAARSGTRIVAELPYGAESA